MAGSGWTLGLDGTVRSMMTPGGASRRSRNSGAACSGRACLRRRVLGALLAVLLAGGFNVAVRSTPASAATVTYNGAVGAPRISMIGDSVMAAIRWGGTWAPLQRYNYTYDAESCRRTIGLSCRGREGFAPDNTVQAMQRLRGQLGSVVFIGTGYDDAGSTFSGGVDAVMAEAAAQGIHTVVWLTMRTADVTYVGPTYSSNASTFRDNNRILLAKQTQYGGRLRIADWATYSAARPDWVLSDGVHLSGSGSVAFARYIVDQATLALRTTGAPAAPVVTATVMGPTEVRLNWAAPAYAGQSAVLEYGLQRSSATDPTWRSGMAGGASARSIVLGGLQPNTTYSFHVAARNASGWSSFSNIVTVTTRVVPPWTPSFNVTVLDPTMVRLHWLPPAITGGAPILEYGFQQWSSSDQRWRSGPAGGPSSRSRTLGGLTPNTTYRFRIAARNSAGWSVMSGIVTVTTTAVPPSAPAATAVVTGPGQVQLSWTVPASTGGGPVLEYGFQRWSAQDPVWRSGPAGSGSARSRSFAGLPPGTYQFRVAARSIGGWGPMSAPVSVTIPGASATTSVAVTELTDDTVFEDAVVEATVVDTAPVESTIVEETTIELGPVDSVSGVVTLDGDGDGVRGESDPPVAGMEVRVVDRSTGATLAVATTKADGSYTLAVPAGQPTIEFVLPDETVPTRVDVGTDDTVDSDADPTEVVTGAGETTVRVTVTIEDDRGHVDVGLVAAPPPETTSTTTAAPTSTVATTSAAAAATTTVAPTTVAPIIISPTTLSPVTPSSTTIATTNSTIEPTTTETLGDAGE